jgi:RNase P subunit RPR2
MGSFDSVFVECSKCGNKIEFQSKAGDCKLKEYHYIAMDLNGKEAICKECHASIKLMIPRHLTRISMEIVHGGSTLIGDRYD